MATGARRTRIGALVALGGRSNTLCVLWIKSPQPRSAAGTKTGKCRGGAGTWTRRHLNFLHDRLRVRESAHRWGVTFGRDPGRASASPKANVSEQSEPVRPTSPLERRAKGTRHLGKKPAEHPLSRGLCRAAACALHPSRKPGHQARWDLPASGIHPQGPRQSLSLCEGNAAPAACSPRAGAESGPELAASFQGREWELHCPGLTPRCPVFAAPCGGTVHNATIGRVLSPSYTGNHSTGMYCVWTIAAPPGQKLHLHFEKLLLSDKDR